MESNQSILWGVKITVRIVLSERDVTSLERPWPLYFQIPRQSYLNIFLSQIKPLWQHLLPPQLPFGSNSPWFAYNKLPLKWNTPIGVLYDLLVPEHDQEPWELCLHFQDYPVDTLPPYVNETSLQDSLRNSLKEASVITTGSATQVISMVSGAHEDLWTAVLQSDVAALKRIFNSIQLNGSPHDGDHGHGMKHLPVRIYVRFLTRSSLSDSVDKDYMSSYENIYRTSRPLLAHNPEDGTPHTLCSALSPLLVQHFSPKEGITQSCVWQHVRQLWVGGIRPPDDAILEHLFKEFHCADYFLYIVVHVQRD